MVDADADADADVPTASFCVRMVWICVERN
jgi:hypothetical protein